MFFSLHSSIFPHNYILLQPDGSILSFTSVDEKVNILSVADRMEQEYKWGIERQQTPPSIHMTLMPPHANRHQAFLSDLQASIAYVRQHPEMSGEGSAAMYGLVAKIPSGAIVEKFLVEFESQVYSA